MAEDSVAKAMNYQGNSNKSKEAAARPQQEKIISGEVLQRKKTLGRKIIETFTGEDVHSVGQYVFFDVALPALKNLISDMVSQGVERMMFGDARPRSSSSNRYGTHTSYNRMYVGRDGRRDDVPRTLSQRARATHDFGEIVLDSRGEAERVLDQLGELVSKYDVATVSDLYSMVGITGSFTDDKYGWTDLRGSAIRRVRDGYLLDLPQTTPID